MVSIFQSPQQANAAFGAQLVNAGEKVGQEPG
jgi:hypothetical protein